MKNVVGLFAVIISLWPILPIQALDFQRDDAACVAWQAKKTMFLFKKVEPVGKNCAIDARFVEGVTQGSYRIEVEVPIKGFDSGEPDRDKDVAEILGADKDPNLTVYTNDLSLERWQALLADAGDVDGYLRIAGSDFPLQIPIASKAEVLVGTVSTSFSALGLQSPKVVFGVVAAVEDELDLHFSLPIKLIQGMSQTMNEPSSVGGAAE